MRRRRIEGSLNNDNGNEESPMSQLEYGSLITLANGSTSQWLDTNGSGGAGLNVTTASSPNRDNGSGSWLILSDQGRGGAVYHGDIVHLINGWSNFQGAWLDTNGWSVVQESIAVATAPNWNRDTGSGSWKISRVGGNSADPISLGDTIQLMNLYPDSQNTGWWLYADSGGVTANRKSADPGSQWVIQRGIRIQIAKHTHSDFIVLNESSSSATFYFANGDARTVALDTAGVITGHDISPAAGAHGYTSVDGTISLIHGGTVGGTFLYPDIKRAGDSWGSEGATR